MGRPCVQVARRVHATFIKPRAQAEAEEGRSTRVIRYRTCCLEEDVYLHPSSGLAKTGPQWIAYTQLLRSGKRPYMGGQPGPIWHPPVLGTGSQHLCASSKGLALLCAFPAFGKSSAAHLVCEQRPRWPGANEGQHPQPLLFVHCCASAEYSSHGACFRNSAHVNFRSAISQYKLCGPKGSSVLMLRPATVIPMMQVPLL